jgi:electron transfer flavoprotein alpha subunit
MNEKAKAPTAAAGNSRANTKKELPEHLKSYKHVWVSIELERGVVHPVSWELLNEGRKLADQLKVDLAGVVLGAPGGTEQAIADCFAYGADVCYVIENPSLADYRNEPYTDAMTELVNKYQPEILLMGATNLGRDLAGSVATTLLTGLTADCTELAVDAEGSLAATRPTFGGSLLCTIFTLNYRPQMATMRPRVAALPLYQAGRTGRIVRHEMALPEVDIITKVLSFLPDTTSDKANLPYADIVVAGGLGMQNGDNYKLVRELAAVLGGEWGGSRPLVQKGWIPSDRQIGQTGKTIRPRLYIAAGISGAIQHRVGVEGADLIVAINTDKNAPIFDFAHVGIVADAAKVLPALTEGFRKRLALAATRNAAE